MLNSGIIRQISGKYGNHFLTGLVATCVLAFVYVYENNTFSDSTLAANTNLPLPMKLDRMEAATSQSAQSNGFDITVVQSKPYVLLQWFPEGQGKNFEGMQYFKGCEYKNCYLTSDKSNLNGSDFVIMELLHVKSKMFALPSYRPTEQSWIVKTLESPYHPSAKYAFDKIGDFTIFNASLSYHSDSDMYSPYGKYIPSINLDDFKPSYKDIRLKSKTIAWFVSHCPTKSRREEYVEELQKYITVDIYGTCGNLTCDRTIGDPASVKDPCFLMIEKTYKFYLSFENSICKDYITEKVWNMLQLNIVPIVLGGADYTNILPPHSYINILDFKSPRHLAHYLHILDENTELYRTYFAWKKHYKIKRRQHNCELCKYANQNHESQTIFDFKEWWTPQQQCKTPSQYYQNRLKL